MTTFIVYSKNFCPGCSKLKARMGHAGLPFVEKNIDTDAEAKAYLLAQGHRSVPQVYAGDNVIDIEWLLAERGL